ncbi:serine hydrolase [Sphingomonas aracearum]|uniref:beta-lactamase n=1 Tax=Sphingomonas aracearum TaxID=2283317 RepID=A0A369VT65_9SPHN|nr:serine hydrolase [Sphingomonas aracearum]RDE04737.1 serine hydrolase [Sphingomonas aracearum]
MGRGSSGIARNLHRLGALALLSLLAACVADTRASRTPAARVPVPSGRTEQWVPPRPVRPQAPAALVETIGDLGRNFGGKVGIAVRAVDGGWSADSNGSLLLPQQSVSKLWVAMTVLDQVDRGRLSLDTPLVVRSEDLTVFHQPMAMLVKGDGYHTDVRELLRRALTTSDNTANDKLLQTVGGPEAVRGFIQRKGLGAIGFGPGERLLQAGTAGLSWRSEYSRGLAFQAARAKLSRETRIAAFDAYVDNPPDGAAPSAIAFALAALARGELLSPASTRYLLSTMEASRTGPQRLRGAVPASWTSAHKTGTGQDLLGRTAGYNDVGLLTAPDGTRYAVAVMIGDTRRSIPQRQALMQAVAAAVVASHRSGPTYARTGAADAGTQK